jgi:hypothetical protein
MHVNLNFSPDANQHTMTAVFTAKGGVKLTCGASGGADVMDDPNPLNNTATVTGTIKPARKPPVYTNTFIISAPILPQTPGSIFLATPTIPGGSGQPIPPLGTLLTPNRTPLQPIITPLFGDGHGGFGPSTFITPDTSGGTPVRINLAPFLPRATGDFHFDIGTLNWSPFGVSIYPSDGGGGFNPPIITPLPGLPSAFVPLDLNGDKKLDLAVTLPGPAPTGGGTSPGSIFLLQGDGTGHFTNITPKSDIEPSTLGVGASPSDIVTGDFNGDGNADLAVANGGSDSVSIFLGDGKGGFSSAGFFPVGSSPSALAVADLNGDGKPDLVVANQGENSVTVLIGDGTGKFSQPFTNFAAGPGPSALTIADFNGDGSLDVAVADGNSNTVTILLGDGSGAMVSDATFTVGTGAASLATADFDGDGKPDLAIASKGDGSITVLLSSSAAVNRPLITQAEKSGKNLLITGTGFDNGATILVDGNAQRTTNDSTNPTTSLFGKKAGKHTSTGSVVQVQTSSGILSQWFIFGK